MKIKKASFFYRFFCSFTVLALVIFITHANFVYALIPSDTEYTSQWYLEKINAPEAWDIKTGSPQVIIAVIDGGVDINHPDLRSNIWINTEEIADNGIDDDNNGFIDDINGWDFVNNVADPRPKFQEGFNEVGIHHGTIIAGIIAAQGNNAFGIAGVSWSARIMPLVALNDKSEGNANNVIKAIDYAIANQADIINLSFVGEHFSDSSLEDAIKRAYRAGIIIVAAAGVDDDLEESHKLDENPAYPICYDGGVSNMVIGVGATDSLDQKTYFSNFGFNCIDIVAPGVSFLGLAVYDLNQAYNNSIFNKHTLGYWSGTSMSTPLVSGSLALIKAVNPKLKRAEVIDILLSNADNISRLNLDYLGQLGSGRLNLGAAVQAAHDNLVSKQGLIITVPQSNSVSSIKVIDTNNKTTEAFNAYNDNFKGGSNLATGDLDGDGIDEIITGAGPSGGPHVRIFDQDGKVKGQFFAYDKNFRGGVNVAVGDLDGDGIDEIITGAGVGGDPQVNIFNSQGKKQGQFFAYGKNFYGGVKVSAGDIDGNGKEEIITGTGKTGGPQIRIFDQDGKVKGQFFAYDKNFRGGVNVGIGDINQDGIDEIITGAGPSGGPHLRVFNATGVLQKGFYTYNLDMNGGVNVAVIKVKVK